MAEGFNLIDQSKVFKKTYVKRSDNMYNSENVLQGRIKKTYDFTGSEKLVQTNLSFSGGVGSGVLPKANAGNYENAKITAKRVYGRAIVEREAMKASADDKGSFVRATAEQVKKTVESYMRNASRILFHDGSGVLGRADGATALSGDGSDATPFVVTISAGSWKEANWEEKDLVQIVSGLATYPDNNTSGTPEGGASDVNLLEIVAVDPDTRKVSLVGTSTVLTGIGTGVVAGTIGLVMQRSFRNDPIGLKTIFDKAIQAIGPTNTLYGIPTQRRWQAHAHNAGGAGINPDLLNAVMLQVKKRSGKFPTMIMYGYEQSRNIKAFLEDQKVYNLPNKNLKGAPGFTGVEFMSDNGSIGMFIDRFADEDKVYFLNDAFIAVHHRPGFGWFDDDGTVFMRLADSDDYEARYGGYYENFITPTFHGFLHGLAV